MGWKKAILALLIPVCCQVCSKEWEYFCHKHKKLLSVLPTLCPFCTAFTPYGNVCTEHEMMPLDGCLVGFYYTRIVQDCIHKIKYGHSYHILTSFAKYLALLLYCHPILQSETQKKNILITYVPMHHRKQKRIRWYNQAEKLARYLADELGVQALPLLQKVEHTISQSRKKAQWRNTIKNPFLALPGNVDQTYILLIDDVLTTGATLRNCAYVLKEAHPDKKIWGVCVARNK
jgi:predicted amidophosphoribosyltransferase